MTREYTLTAETDRLAWRQQLIDEVKPGDEIIVSVPGDLTFTHLRQLITALNTVAWQRGAVLRYDTEPTATPPPLQIYYSKAPSITRPKL